jgi:hypothetical protein
LLRFVVVLSSFFIALGLAQANQIPETSTICDNDSFLWEARVRALCDEGSDLTACMQLNQVSKVAQFIGGTGMLIGGAAGAATGMTKAGERRSHLSAITDTQRPNTRHAATNYYELNLQRKLNGVQFDFDLDQIAQFKEIMQPSLAKAERLLKQMKIPHEVISRKMEIETTRVELYRVRSLIDQKLRVLTPGQKTEQVRRILNQNLDKVNLDLSKINSLSEGINKTIRSNTKSNNARSVVGRSVGGAVAGGMIGVFVGVIDHQHNRKDVDQCVRSTLGLKPNDPISPDEITVLQSIIAVNKSPPCTARLPAKSVEILLNAPPSARKDIFKTSPHLCAILQKQVQRSANAYQARAQVSVVDAKFENNHCSYSLRIGNNTYTGQVENSRNQLQLTTALLPGMELNPSNKSQISFGVDQNSEFMRPNSTDPKLDQYFKVTMGYDGHPEIPWARTLENYNQGKCKFVTTQSEGKHTVEPLENVACTAAHLSQATRLKLDDILSACGNAIEQSKVLQTQPFTGQQGRK